MTVKIKSPSPGYNGWSTFGPYRVEFRDGVAEAPAINDSLQAWLKDHGYEVSGRPEKDAPDPGRKAGYVPADHTEKEVLEHAASLGPEEVASLIQEERAGKNRKGVLDGLSKIHLEDLIGDKK